MMKTTKLTPRSRSPVIISSLDNTRAMGRIAEDFMVDDYLPSTKIASPSPQSSPHRGEEARVKRLSSKERGG
jgi:hypothetical protein